MTGDGRGRGGCRGGPESRTPAVTAMVCDLPASGSNSSHGVPGKYCRHAARFSRRRPRADCVGQLQRPGPGRHRDSHSGAGFFFAASSVAENIRVTKKVSIAKRNGLRGEFDDGKRAKT